MLLIVSDSQTVSNSNGVNSNNSSQIFKICLCVSNSNGVNSNSILLKLVVALSCVSNSNGVNSN